MKPYSLAIILSLSYCFSVDAKPKLVDISEYKSGIVTEMRYFTDNNFVGTKINGYQSAKCLLSEKAASALVAAQSDFLTFGLTIKVFDCYRPQRAVDHFVSWANDINDTKMKAFYYPKVAKKELFSKGYIAAKSGHSRASTVDITLVEKDSLEPLDMGTPWDYFSPLSAGQNPHLSSQVKANRMLLAKVMALHGFKPLKEEWWHFTLKDEPYKNSYFDIPIE
ncbi:M15 family metallopeptidase [Pseudoalteromonas sp.]|uniref:M15 family metallopeptidase n=1 Tax=Pseudoalteromonas sp. TaxID=53249 RepID=UPI003562F233